MNSLLEIINKIANMGDMNGYGKSYSSTFKAEQAILNWFKFQTNTQKKLKMKEETK